MRFAGGCGSPASAVTQNLFPDSDDDAAALLG
jgi:hypothetical protein